MSGQAVDSGARCAWLSSTVTPGSVPSVGSMDGLRLTIGYPWKMAGRCTTKVTFKRYAGVVTSNGIEGEHQTRKWQSGGGT